MITFYFDTHTHTTTMSLPPLTHNLPTDDDFLEELDMDDAAYVTNGKYTPLEMQQVYNAFCANVGSQISTDQARKKAFAMFLLFLADAGGSSVANSSSRITVTVNGSQLVGNSFTQIHSALKRLGSFFTAQRCLWSWADLVSRILDARPQMSQWGIKNGIPDAYKKYAFPHGDTVTNCPADARAAVSAARMIALREAGSTSMSNHFLVRGAAETAKAPETSFKLTF